MTTNNATTGRARFCDGPNDTATPTIPNSTVVGVYPAGGHYRIEQMADGTWTLFRHAPEGAASTNDRSSETARLVAINAANRRFYDRPAPARPGR